jgi:hypothetical protein
LFETTQLTLDKHTLNTLQELLSKALKAEGSEMGLIRNFKPDDDELDIVCHQGFENEFVFQFHSVKPFDHTSCGRAFGIGSTVLINDIELDLSFKKQIKFLRALNTDFRAVKSVPILTKRGRKVGILSIFFKEPKWDWHFSPNDEIELAIAEILYGIEQAKDNALARGEH